MVNRKQFIEELVKSGVNESTARYQWSRYKDGKDYKPRPRKGLTQEYLGSLGVYVGQERVSHKVYDYDCDTFSMIYSNEWVVYQVLGVDELGNEIVKKRPIYPLKTGDYKNTDCKYHLYTWFIDENSKQRLISLASLIMVSYLHKDIPAGYVVDHIDNDSFNNDPRNLQIISISDNVKKDHKGHNQYNYDK